MLYLLVYDKHIYLFPSYISKITSVLINFAVVLNCRAFSLADVQQNCQGLVMSLKSDTKSLYYVILYLWIIKILQLSWLFSSVFIFVGTYCTVMRQ